MTFSLVMAGLVVFSLFWRIIFGIFYYRDLAHYHEPPLKNTNWPYYRLEFPICMLSYF